MLLLWGLRAIRSTRRASMRCSKVNLRGRPVTRLLADKIFSVDFENSQVVCGVRDTMPVGLFDFGLQIPHERGMVFLVVHVSVTVTTAVLPLMV